MIHLTRLNGSPFYLNAEHIQTVEATPDTHIVLTNGQQFVAAESAEEVARRAVEYQRRIRRPLRALSAAEDGPFASEAADGQPAFEEAR